MFDRPFVMLGGGGHARVVLELLQCLGATVNGVCDPALAAQSAEWWMGIDVLGDDSALCSVSPDEVYLANGIGMMPGADLRQRLFQTLTDQGYEFPALIHPAASVSDGARISPGAQVMRGSVVQTCAVIGRNTIVNTSASVDHDCQVGAHCHVAPGVTLCGEVTVKEGAFVGAGATVIQGVRIGAGAVIGAGSVVLKDVAGGRVHHSGQRRPVGETVTRGS
ncbi:MAG: acetyltransferase [Marinobacter sp.]|uniref:acetyltransferase n=1 Tax=Marinobacter sp. TaxID=50741 RepID=UPI00299F4D13|nr:acetyltransferase [Marinobacter sp.]MDX1754696.1 acetyltransferase [Marinobacter sp.]